jgi:hypothetical protein
VGVFGRCGPPARPRGGRSGIVQGGRCWWFLPTYELARWALRGFRSGAPTRESRRARTQARDCPAHPSGRGRRGAVVLAAFAEEGGRGAAGVGGGRGVGEEEVGEALEGEGAVVRGDGAGAEGEGLFEGGEGGLEVGGADEGEERVEGQVVAAGEGGEGEIGAAEVGEEGVGEGGGG